MLCPRIFYLKILGLVEKEGKWERGIMEEYNLVPPPEARYTVYKLTDPEGKIYIGCTGQTVERRWHGGAGYRGSVFYDEAIQRYGWQNIKKEILCEKLTKVGGEKLEEWFVNYYDSMNPDKGYNRMTGGNHKGAKHSAQSVEQNRRNTLANYEGHPEFCQMHSESKRTYYRDHPEARKRISQQMREYVLSLEGRAFLHSSRKAKPVRCVETGETFPSLRSAERARGSGVKKACSGKQVISCGYHWEFVLEKDRAAVRK